MAILIPSLIHAACVVSVQTSNNQPKLVSALGVKSVARRSPGFVGAFDLKLEQSVDPRAALLYSAVNWTMGPPVSIQAIMDSTDATLVHVYASQSVVASGNITAAAAAGNAYGIAGVSHPATGVYTVTLEASLTVQNGGYDGVGIFVTPDSGKTFAYWTVNSATEFQINTLDGTGSAVDAGFSLALLYTGQGAYTVDCDFSLLVADLGAAGVLPASD
jgi:hypothetical protein